MLTLSYRFPFYISSSKDFRVAFSIKNWLSSFQKYFFFYRDGFYELPFVANSPELIVKSFGSMPFVKNYPEKQYFTTNTMFLEGEGYYQKLEDGLWLIISNLNIKKDLSFKLWYEPGMEANYHTLNIYVNRNAKVFSFPKMQVDIEFADHTWGLYKAGTRGINSHFKGQKSSFLNIYFSKEWAYQNIAHNGVLKNKVLEEFFNSEKESLFLPNFLENKREVYENVIHSFLNQSANGGLDILMLKRNTLEIISTFVEKLDRSLLDNPLVSLSDKDKRRMVRAEYIISSAIFHEFPSLEFIAKEVGISLSKLKTDFKEVYGTTPYQYFSNKQMTYAKELLSRKNVSVKEVAITLGFQNASKFSDAFRRVHGHLPSEV